MRLIGLIPDGPAALSLSSSPYPKFGYQRSDDDVLDVLGDPEYHCAMPKRHRMVAGDWESIVGRLQELVLANSGEDEFQEIFKILVAKLFAEKYPRRLSFRPKESPEATARSINELLARASSRWPGIVEGDPQSHLTDEHLTICVEEIMNQSISDTNLEVLDGFFEYLVSHVAKGAKGQYFTPRQIVDCCVKIVNPLPTESVLDPACGSGGFLVHALNHNIDRLAVPPRTYCASQLWGCDFDRRAIQIAKALMLVAGDCSSSLHQVNSLVVRGSYGLFEGTEYSVPRLTIEDLVRSKARNFDGFDVVLTNPPFAGEIREAALMDSYRVAKRNRRMERDVLFLERCVQLLRPGGRLCIVLPHNKFAGPGWSYLREWLIRHVRVVAVLGLDRNTFLPHTHQKTSVLFGVRRKRAVRELENEPILFAVSERSGKDSKGRLVARNGSSGGETAWERSAHDLDTVVEAFDRFARTHEIEWSSECR